MSENNRIRRHILNAEEELINDKKNVIYFIQEQRDNASLLLIVGIGAGILLQYFYPFFPDYFHKRVDCLLIFRYLYIRKFSSTEIWIFGKSRQGKTWLEELSSQSLKHLWVLKHYVIPSHCCHINHVQEP